jgi:hypothetical protein
MPVIVMCRQIGDGRLDDAAIAARFTQITFARRVLDRSSLRPEKAGDAEPFCRFVSVGFRSA